MATDVDVQFFSHLNGLTLGNNWGDLIRLLDKALVTGIDFIQITLASIDEQGDVHLTLYAAHNTMLLQVVELSGFAPTSLNQKYRVKGVPSATKLILKPHTAIVETSITTVGSGKLAPLGYDIIFRDLGDVKRVYRAKNPTAQHPFIRVDETISDGVNSYNSAYAKYAMVGLIENMTHIDDYLDPNKLQLPLDTTDLAKNWKITGTGRSVIRGWSKWHWAMDGSYVSGYGTESETPSSGARNFTLVGDTNAFYLVRSFTPGAAAQKLLCGCGLINSVTNDLADWFIAGYTRVNNADNGLGYANNSTATGTHPFMYNTDCSKVQMGTHGTTQLISNSVWATPILINYASGQSTIYKNNVAALEIPVTSDDGYLRGSFKHIAFAGKDLGAINTSPILTGSSMYVAESLDIFRSVGGVYFYLGELE